MPTQSATETSLFSSCLETCPIKIVLCRNTFRPPNTPNTLGIGDPHPESHISCARNSMHFTLCATHLNLLHSFAHPLGAHRGNLPPRRITRRIRPVPVPRTSPVLKHRGLLRRRKVVKPILTMREMVVCSTWPAGSKWGSTIGRLLTMKETTVELIEFQSKETGQMLVPWSAGMVALIFPSARHKI